MVKFMDFSRALSVFSSTFQGKFHFQGLFKTVLYIQVLFNPVGTLFFVITKFLTHKMCHAIVYNIQQTAEYKMCDKTDENMQILKDTHCSCINGLRFGGN